VTVFQNVDDQAFFLDNWLTTRGRQCLILGSGIDVDALDSSMPTESERAKLRGELGCTGTVVVMVSRLVRDKGVLEYLEAARRVRAEAPETTFLLVGPYSTDRRQAVPVEVIAAQSDVIATGARADAGAIMAVSDVCVLPTAYGEGIPRVLMEAGALGLPLVATDVPGCRDVVTPGWNGFLVPVGDVIELSSKILQLVRDPEERRLLGRRSASLVRASFTLDMVCDAYALQYERVLREKKSLGAV
jgi:glycosyltransferase involved in cell wall biosynthesis